MAKLSVNINKIATLRNSRGGNNPDLVKVALDCERFGAEGHHRTPAAGRAPYPLSGCLRPESGQLLQSLTLKAIAASRSLLIWY
jgi:hypothetical protein